MKCPICESKELTRIHFLCDNMKVLGSSFPNKAAYVSGCKKCGLVFTETEASQDDFLDYYKYNAVSPKYYDMFGKDESEEYYNHLISLIEPYVNRDDSILDIAGAWGEFGAYMQKQGYNNVTVLDPCEKCIDVAKEKGLNTVLASSIDMDKYIHDAYRIVILNHSLEHILDVKSTFENIIDILDDDGYLFIEVPDVEEYVNEEAAPFNFLTFEHVLHLSLSDLHNLARIYGFEICDEGKYYKKVSRYPSIYVILKRSQKVKQAISFSDTPINKMTKYINKSKKAIMEFVEPLKKSQEPLSLWGIGASTAILLNAFEGCNVISLVDRNPSRQGLEYKIGEKKFVIEDPKVIKNETIVVMSIPYYSSICNQIKESGLKNKITGFV